jgi:hypothetical protein
LNSENPILARKLARLQFKDGKNILTELRLLEQQDGIAALPERVRNLRTNDLKPWREARSAAMFCYLMGQALGEPIYLAAVEDEDFDFVALQQVDDANHFKLCQLKELVPAHLNPQATLN